MKAFKLLAAVLAFTAVNVSAQTAVSAEKSVDQIVNDYVTALGGKEKLESLKTVKMQGTMNTQGADVSLTMTKSHMVGFRMDIEVMGTSNYQIANKTEGWVFMPVMGMKEPQKMDDAQYKASVNQFDLQGALVNYKDKGTAIESLGKETVDGSEAYKLKLTFSNGETSNYFIDAKTNRLVKISGKRTINGEEMDIATSFSDFKQNADGFWFPYTMETIQGKVYFEKVETNVPAEDNLFKN